ncbi:hypothetical protein [Glycomyces salinus]|uniref:hypothetical protein n=1 Tax=Glycomyces salinus TaxID=980294 RepID=UPI0018EBF8A3|nr:hypothetical protein [Glycomyces salinus]
MIRLVFPDKTERVIVWEVQSEWTKAKYFRLPGYVARIFEDYRCQVELLMICKTDALAERYREGIRLGDHSVVMPSAIGPGDLLPITEPESRGQSAHRSVATLLMQGKPNDEFETTKVAAVLADGFATIDPEQAGDYAYILTRVIGEEFEVTMEATKKGTDPEWWDRYVAKMAGEGRQKALDEGLDRGMRTGFQLGREDGLEKGRNALLRALNSLGIEVGSEARQRIETCSDLESLLSWMERAHSVRSVDELFG